MITIDKGKNNRQYTLITLLNYEQYQLNGGCESGVTRNTTHTVMGNTMGTHETLAWQEFQKEEVVSGNSKNSVSAVTPDINNKDLTTTTTITKNNNNNHDIASASEIVEEGESDGVSFPGPLRDDRQDVAPDAEISQTPEDDVDKLANRYIELRAAGFYVRPEDYESIANVLKVVPISEALKLLEARFEDFEKSKRPGQKITVFSYCEGYIIDRHQENQAREEAKKALQQADHGNEEKQKQYTPTDIPFRLATHFFERIRRNNSDFLQPDMQKWAAEIKQIMVEDNRTEEQVIYVIDWTQKDSFWKGYILSPVKLRNKFDQLVILIKSEKEKQKQREPRGQGYRNPKKDKLPKWLIEEKEKQKADPIPPIKEEDPELEEKHQKFQKLMEERRRRKEDRGDQDESNQSIKAGS